MDEVYENLANEIILLAVKDYRQAMRSRNPVMQTRLEKFFRSTWFGVLTKMDPEFLITRLKEENVG